MKEEKIKKLQRKLGEVTLDLDIPKEARFYWGNGLAFRDNQLD